MSLIGISRYRANVLWTATHKTQTTNYRARAAPASNVHRDDEREGCRGGERHNERGSDTEQAGVDSRMKNGCWIATTNNCPTRRGVAADVGGLPFDGKTMDLTEHH